ncbi:TonB-dependent siderophore receptor [Alcaligenaceae bacterium 429]|uniref:TonB-dependent siderophore receptor n=1 Tax=Paenalcaligenes sp. Me52 TaxID=3392038 RepID=UPI001092E65B|nr:TonB-dependent siderophore receptor [Alcaligenaceae bacterium 429]
MDNRPFHSASRRLASRSALCLNLTAMAVMGTFSLSMPMSVHAQGEVVQISLPAQPLEDSLIQLGRQTDLQFFYMQQVVAGIQAPPVQGAMTPEQALQRLLQGAPVQYKREGKNVILSPLAEAAQLAPVSVIGSRGAETDGSGSYATDAVTMFRGVTSLREIPQSVSVMTRQQIEDRGWTTSADALRQVTGVTLSGYEGQEAASIRGFAANVQADGVPIQSSYTGAPGNSTIAQYDRLEVLRGPSALLSGSGEPGGTINYVRKRPLKEFAFSGAVRAGSWSNKGVELDVSGPLTEGGRLRARGVLSHDDKDTFYETWFNRYTLLYGAIEYDLTPNTTLGLTGTYGYQKTIVNWGLPRYMNGELPGRDSFVGSDKPSTRESPELSADLTHRFDNGWETKLIYNYGRVNIEQYSFFNTRIDENTGLSSGGSLGYLDESRIFQGADLSASGPFELLGQTHELTLGYNISQRDYRSGQAYTSPAPHYVLDDHGSYEFGSPTDRSQTITKQSGLYAAARFSITDDFRLILGSRWTDYSSKSRTTWPMQTSWKTSNAKASNEFTPYGGLVWDFHPDMTWYASYADTFVPQTNFDYSGNILDPRVGWQAETGLKGEFMDGKLNATLAFFYLEDKNRAMVDDAHVGCGGSSTGTCYLSAGKVRSKGVELEVMGSPTPGWDISASYTWNRSKIVKDSNAAKVGTPLDSRVPVHMVKLWTQYRFNSKVLDGALQGWTVGAGLNLQSDTYNGIYTQGGYATVAAKVGYQINPHWNVDLLVDNVFNRTYLRQIGSAGFGNFYGAPRSVMLNLRWKY